MIATHARAFTLIQLVVVVFVLAVLLRVVLHIPTQPTPRHTEDTHHALKQNWQRQGKLIGYTTQGTSLHSPIQDQDTRPVTTYRLTTGAGPLLARVVTRQRLAAADDCGSDVVDSLPPSAAPRVIVILPSVEKPEAVPDREKCAPAPLDQAHTSADRGA